METNATDAAEVLLEDAYRFLPVGSRETKNLELAIRAGDSEWIADAANTVRNALCEYCTVCGRVSDSPAYCSDACRREAEYSPGDYEYDDGR